MPKYQNSDCANEITKPSRPETSKNQQKQRHMQWRRLSTAAAAANVLVLKSAEPKGALLPSLFRHTESDRVPMPHTDALRMGC